ncbi:WXG100 family type VII secretion target [Streptomyces noursei]|uniref:WXG100-like domain-containing protein n=1 Tax=Streptomyces noursei TaxID=1971 RepID=UPI003331E196
MDAIGGISMAIELPGQVVSFLQFIGVNWPDINEDKVREFGSHVRDFAQKVDDAHRDSTSTINPLEDVYQGASCEALLAKWGQLSDSRMTELVNACHTVADALDIAADTIVAMKLEATVELTVLAIAFIADQAAAVATLGLAEAAEALVIEAAESALGVSAGGAGGRVGESFSIHPAMQARAEKPHAHARTAAGHAAEFETKAAGASFV